MPKDLEFHFDVDEDEETWLTPQLSERSLGTESKPVDLKEWFGQIQTSERASILSKKLQKYAQKRAARSDRLRKGIPSSLDVVKEGDGSPEETHSSHHQKPTDDGGISTSCSETVTTKTEVATLRNETNESGIATGTEIFTSPEIVPSNISRLKPNVLTTSTPFADSVSGVGLPDLSPSPVELAASEKQIMTSDSDEEFYDASSDFCEEVQNLLLTSSVHEDQNNGNGMLPNDGDSGISAGRNCMTQSLMKVEEEMPSGQQAYMTKDGKPLRSSSVSPRPVTTAISHSKPIQTNSLASNDSVDSIEQHRNKSSTTATPSFSRTTEIKQQTRLSRPTTSHRSLPSPRQSAPVSHGIDKQHVVVNTRVPNPKAQLLHNLISVPLENKEQPDRNRNVNSVTDAKNSCPTFGNYPPSKTQSEIPDLAALREIARQQEQALRQAVEKQLLYGNTERKYSWQNETNSKSPYSSASSLVSSKSADMSTLHKTNANVTSRIPSCTRVPKKSGIPTPSRRAGVPVRCASVAPQPTTNDDECF